MTPAESATMASDLSFKQQIALAIKPSNESSDEPPFSMEELVVMCLASEDQHMSTNKIAIWIMNHCRWYREVTAIAVLVYGDLPKDDHRQDLYDALNHESYELPIYETGEETGVWYTTTGEAMSLLTPIMADLFPKCYPRETSETHFDFFKLPAELRNNIYDMVFTHPDGVLEVNGGFAGNANITLNTYGVPYKSESREAILLWMLNAEKQCAEETMWYELSSTSEILEPLAICQQFNQEASASFFGRNTFYANELNSLHTMLSALLPSRRQLITSLAFAYWPNLGDTKVAAETFAMLAAMPRLRAIRILIDEAAWTKATKKRTGARTYPDLKKLPGFPTLKTVRVRDEVIFYRTNDEAAQMLRTAMLSPQDEAPEKKRKAKRAKKGETGPKQTDQDP